MRLQRLHKVLLPFIVFSLGLGCCSGKEPLPEPLLFASETELQFDERSGEKTITIKSDQEINASSNESWCNMTIGKAVSGSGGFLITPLTIAVNANTDSNERMASVNIRTASLTQVISVKQANNEILPVELLSDAMTMAAKMNMGWNIGNSLEATGGASASETMWGNPKVTKELIAAVKAAGFNTIRIPCAWNGYMEDKATHKIKQSWLSRVEEVVKYCLENQMVAILNIHWDGGWLENNCTPEKQVENNEKQAAIWTQIATHFRDYGENLLFAGANEPNVENATQMGVLLSYHQTFIDAVRATGGNNSSRNLIIQGPSTDITKTNELMTTLPSDPAKNRLMVEVHYYSPWNFCGLSKDESWGKMFYYWGSGFHFGDPVRDASWGEEEYVNSQFADMKKKFINKNIPVIVGEYGAMKRILPTQAEQNAHEASRLYYLEYVTRQAKAAGLVPVYWDNGAAESRLFDRATATIADQSTLNALMKGAE